MTRSGAAACSLPKCKYFDQLMFIRDKVANKETSSNLQLPSPNVVETPITQAIVNGQTPIVTPTSINDHTPTGLKRKEDLYYVSTCDKTRRKNEIANNVDLMLLKTVKDIDQNNSAESPENTDTHFCMSLVEQMNKLPKKKNRIARMEFQKILFNLEFSDEETD